MEEILVYFSIKYGGDWDKIYAAISKKEKVSKQEIDSTLLENKNKYITILSENYPSRLKNIYKPPFVLFYKGDIDLINTPKKTVGVVGSRSYSSYGKFATDKLVKELTSQDCVIVSGLAKGIDSIGHLSCLENNGKTIAVLGNGLEVSYPQENFELQAKIADSGLVVSEYPDYLEPSKDNFPKRNRIVAGLSDGILVTEASIKSGSMITVSRALEMGKEIFCVPYKLDCKSGCNSLIKEGAKLVECAKDIVEEL